MNPKRRRKPSFNYERRLWQAGYQTVAGIDEVGRGCLAGPVVAAAVILPPGIRIHRIDDSKRMAAALRETVTANIMRRAVAVGIGICAPEEIDRLNILHASLEAMRRAVQELTPRPSALLIDGLYCYPECPIHAKTVVRGDTLSKSIAAASIVAKTVRDGIMRDLHEDFPAYGWNTNVGYPTPAHYDALALNGPTPIHRASFNLMPPMCRDKQARSC